MSNPTSNLLPKIDNDRDMMMQTVPLRLLAGAMIVELARVPGGQEVYKKMAWHFPNASVYTLHLLIRIL